MIAEIRHNGWWFPNRRGRDHFTVGRGSSICGTFKRDLLPFRDGCGPKNPCLLCTAMLARAAKTFAANDANKKDGVSP